MGKKLSLTVAKRSEIITLHKESYSVRKICKKLKVARSTVQDTIKRWKETGIFEDKKDLVDHGKQQKQKIIV